MFTRKISLSCFIVLVLLFKFRLRQENLDNNICKKDNGLHYVNLSSLRFSSSPHSAAQLINISNFMIFVGLISYVCGFSSTVTVVLTGIPGEFQSFTKVETDFITLG